jgi:hypothetical protein
MDPAFRRDHDHDLINLVPGIERELSQVSSRGDTIPTINAAVRFH